MKYLISLQRDVSFSISLFPYTILYDLDLRFRISKREKNVKIWPAGQNLMRIKLGKMRPVMRKPAFGVSDQVRVKPAYSATETSYRLEILTIASGGVIPSRQRTTKAMIRRRGCASWSAPLLFAYGKNRVSHDVAQIHWCGSAWFIL